MRQCPYILFPSSPLIEKRTDALRAGKGSPAIARQIFRNILRDRPDLQNRPQVCLCSLFLQFSGQFPDKPLRAHQGCRHAAKRHRDRRLQMKAGCRADHQDCGRLRLRRLFSDISQTSVDPFFLRRKTSGDDRRRCFRCFSVQHQLIRDLRRVLQPHQKDQCAVQSRQCGKVFLLFRGGMPGDDRNGLGNAAVCDRDPRMTGDRNRGGDPRDHFTGYAGFL